jgi:hypothetical protein
MRRTPLYAALGPVIELRTARTARLYGEWLAGRAAEPTAKSIDSADTSLQPGDVYPRRQPAAHNQKDINHND